MKHLVVLFFILLVGPSFAQGINFETTDFQAVLDKAKAEDKLVFMDAYTTWCGPCKWMSKNVFTESNVGEYFNDKFINAKVDMEKGEGIDLAKKYEVSAYPTLLFINGDGDLVHMSIGSRPADDFLDLGNAANDPNRQVMTLKKRFENGERSADFLHTYTDALTSAGMKNFDEVAQMYMETQEDWNSPENLKFIFDYSGPTLDSKLFKYSLDNKDLIIELVGEEKFNQKVTYAADRDRSKKGIERGDVVNLKTHYSEYFDAETANNMAMKSYMTELMYSKDPVEQEKFKAEVQLFLASKPDLGSNFYNSVAWQVYEITDDEDLLKKAAEWTQISIDEKKNSYNTDTMAAILFKLGNMEKARAFAIESIELAKKEGNDFSATEELLSKIDMK
jgi:thiol-disulfide isomerase/thioredoxin